MALINTKSCLTEFDIKVNEILQLSNDSKSMFLKDKFTKKLISYKKKELIVGLSLLQLHSAWESFIEDTFIRYLCGAVSPSGFKPTLVSLKEKNIPSALSTLLSGQNYINWSPKNTTSRSKKYFSAGTPYTNALAVTSSVCEDINIIRNRFAHRSIYSLSEFHKVVRREVGFIPIGMTVGRFLQSCSSSPTHGGNNYIEYYANVLQIASKIIVP